MEQDLLYSPILTAHENTATLPMHFSKWYLSKRKKKKWYLSKTIREISVHWPLKKAPEIT